MPTIKFAGSFDANYQDLQKVSPDIKIAVNQKVTWFKKNPNDTRLNNHPLTKRMEGRWAFGITGDIRIVYKWSNRVTVRFLSIGPHKEVYSKKVIKKKKR